MVSIHTIDARTWTPGYSSVYLVSGKSAALVETGLSLSAPAILQGIKDHGVRPEEVSHIIVTHIHLDHMGGAGLLVRHLPNAKVVVHRLGVRYMVDPARLIASAKEALGDFAKAYGMEAVAGIDPSRVEAASDGGVIDLGNTRLTVLDAPGHASHNLCFHEASTNGIFTGDTGVHYPETGDVSPSTPAPNFDLEALIRTIERLKALKPDVLYFSHFGPHRNPAAALERLAGKAQEWDAVARKTIDEKRGLEYLVRYITDEERRSAPSLPAWLIEDFSRANAVGLMKYHKVQL